MIKFSIRSVERSGFRVRVLYSSYVTNDNRKVVCLTADGSHDSYPKDLAKVFEAYPEKVAHLLEKWTLLIFEDDAYFADALKFAHLQHESIELQRSQVLSRTL